MKSGKTIPTVLPGAVQVNPQTVRKLLPVCPALQINFDPCRMAALQPIRQSGAGYAPDQNDAKKSLIPETKTAGVRRSQSISISHSRLPECRQNIECMAGQCANHGRREKGSEKIPGIGPDLAARINEIVITGTCAVREQLRELLAAVRN